MPTYLIFYLDYIGTNYDFDVLYREEISWK